MNFRRPSPTQEISFAGIKVTLKRDDLIHPDFSGNKARKLWHFLSHDQPGISRLVSQGSAQSNAMYSLSVLAKMRGWSFDYYVDHVASFLRENPHGNYAAALRNGMRIVKGGLPNRFDAETLFIPEGGACQEAATGIRMLAEELLAHFGETEVDIFLPSGTGTTAFFLQQYLPYRVVTTPCVGSPAYLRRQFEALSTADTAMPEIFESRKRYHFGKLYPDFFKIWVELKEETGVTFDLLYDPKGWITLLEHRVRFAPRICYIHQGGIMGNESMLRRYRRQQKLMDTERI